MSGGNPREEMARRARERSLRDSERHALAERMRTRRISGRQAAVRGIPTFADYFWQDSVNEVIYAVSRFPGGRVSLNLRETTDDWEETLGWALGGEWGQFEAGAKRWLEDAAHQLLWTGLACFEVVVGGPLPSTSKVNLLIEEVGLKGRLITPLGAAQGGFTFAELRGLEFVLTWTPRSRLHILKMPPELGGLLGHRAMMWALSRLRLGPPTWFLKEMERTKELPDYAVGNEDERKNVVAGMLTRHWGWNCRYGLSNRIATPYDAERRDRWIWSTSLLREYVLQELTRLVRGLGCPGTVTLEESH